MSLETMRGTLRALAEEPKSINVCEELKDWEEGYRAALRNVATIARKALEGEPELEEGENDTF